MNPRKKTYYLLSAVFFALSILASFVFGYLLWGPGILVLPMFVAPFLFVSIIFFFFAFFQPAGGAKDIVKLPFIRETAEVIKPEHRSLLTPIILIGLGVVVFIANMSLEDVFFSEENLNRFWSIFVSSGALSLLGLGLFLKRIIEGK